MMAGRKLKNDMNDEVFMKRIISVLLILLFISVPVYADIWQDIKDANKRKDYKTAHKLLLPLAEQGNAKAQYTLAVL